MTRQPRGFTLIEVLVALAILAIALGASVRAVGEHARSHEILRDGSYARWVAANVIAQTRLAEPWPRLGEREGQSRMASRDWRWQLEVSDTPDADMRRLDVRVYEGTLPLTGREPVVQLSGFVSGRDRRT